MDRTQTIRVAYVGIDTSKKHLDVRVLIDQNSQYRKVDQSVEGYRDLLAWLGRIAAEAKCHFCLEATGRYSDAPAEFFNAAGHIVSIVNPHRIKHEAQAQGSRNKTDKADAKVIARYCRDKKPEPHRPPSKSVRELQDRTRHRDNLLVDLQKQKNRLSEPGLSDVVRESLNNLIKTFELEIKQIDEQIKEQIASDEQLKQDFALLTSVNGIGSTTASVLLSELPRIADCPSASSLAAFAGLNPVQRQSGTSSKPTHISHMGSARLRKYLYMPAMAALRCNPSIQALAARLEQKRHGKMSIITAAMRKLLMIAYGVLKSRKPYQPDYNAKPALQTA